MLRTAVLFVALASSVCAFTPGGLTGRFSGNSGRISPKFFADVIEDVVEGGNEYIGEPEVVLTDMEELEAVMSDVDPEQFGPPKPFVNQQAIQAAVEKYKRHSTDSGSPEYQIAVAHERIKYLTAHCQRNPKDYATRRGLVAIVNKRRRMLNYLFRENPSKALTMVSELGVRFKPPGSVQTRAEKYVPYVLFFINFSYRGRDLLNCSVN